MSSHSDCLPSSPSFIEPTSNLSSGPLSLLNNSSPGTTSHGPCEVQEVESITQILCERVGEVQRFKSNRHTITINMVPDEVLLEIFDSFLKDHNWANFFGHDTPARTWHKLVHVCQKWRQIIFGSPYRLKLQILCSHGTPVRKILDCWPSVPIVIRYHPGSYYSFPGDEVGIFAALEHCGRIHQIYLSLTGVPPGPQFDKVATVLQRPFPALTHMALRYQDEDSDYGGSDLGPDEDPIYERPSALPSRFLGGSAPSLQHLFLDGFPFPALPALLLSTSDLVHLDLRNIHYISPEAMVACLAVLPKLKYFRYWAISHFDQILLPPVTRTLLSTLTSITLHGAGKYLEDLISRIDGPQVKTFTIMYSELFNFQFPQFFNFINRLKNPKITYAYVHFSADEVQFGMYRHPRPDHNLPVVNLPVVCATIPCQEMVGRKIPRISQLFSQHSMFPSRVVHLKLTECGGGCRDDEWPLLLLQFPAVRTLHAAGVVALALEHIMVAEVLPVLDLIYFDFEDQPVSSVEKFVTARRLSGHPVMIIDTEAEFEEKVRCY